MKKLFFYILVVGAVVLNCQQASAQKLASYASKWNTGAAVEHDEDLINRMQLEEKSQFLFLISNDEKLLYIDLIVADKASIQKIMRYGLTTWFNPEAKTKKMLGIEFPVSAEGKSEPNFMRDKNADRKEMRMAMMAAKNQDMTLIGFAGKNERQIIDPRNDGPFHGNIEMMEGGRLKISISAPLDKLQRADSSSFTSPVSIGFETGYMDVTGQNMPSGGGQSSSGSMGGGGGMYGGGGPPPGGGGTGTMSGSPEQQERPDAGQMANPTKLWIKQVTLAKNPVQL